MIFFLYCYSYSIIPEFYLSLIYRLWIFFTPSPFCADKLRIELFSRYIYFCSCLFTPLSWINVCYIYAALSKSFSKQQIVYDSLALVLISTVSLSLKLLHSLWVWVNNPIFP